MPENAKFNIGFIPELAVCGGRNNLHLERVSTPNYPATQVRASVTSRCTKVGFEKDISELKKKYTYKVFFLARG